MFNVTHGKHISIWELRKVQEYHTGKILLVWCLGLKSFSFLSLCLRSKRWFTFVKYTPDMTNPLLCVTAKGEDQLMQSVVISSKSLQLGWRAQPRIYLINSACRELLILKVFLEHQLINFHKVPLKGRQLKYPQCIDWRNWSSDSVQGAQQRSGLGSFWLLGLCSSRMLLVLMQNMFKSTLKKWKIGM